jgi:hypothetical protein
VGNFLGEYVCYIRENLLYVWNGVEMQTAGSVEVSAAIRKFEVGRLEKKGPKGDK